MIIAKCNRCSKEIEEIHCYNYVGRRTNPTSIAFSGGGVSFELCDDCHKFVQETIVDRVNKEKPNG